MPKDDQGESDHDRSKFDGGIGCRDYYDENNGWTYGWQVQHDLAGLIDLIGAGRRSKTGSTSCSARSSDCRQQLYVVGAIPDRDGRPVLDGQRADVPHSLSLQLH